MENKEMKETKETKGGGMRFLVLFLVIMMIIVAILNPEIVKSLIQKFTESSGKSSEEGVYVLNTSDYDETGCVRNVWVNGVRYKHFVQTKGPYASKKFTHNKEKKYISKAGCSYVTCSSIASGYDITVTPEKAFKVMSNNFAHDDDIAKCLKKLGIEGKWYPYPKNMSSKQASAYFLEKAKNALEEGEPFIFLVSKKQGKANKAKPNDFWTTGAHFVGVVAVDGKNVYTVDSKYNGKNDLQRYIYSEGLEKMVLYVTGIWVPDEAPKADSLTTTPKKETAPKKETETKEEKTIFSSIKDFFSFLSDLFSGKEEENATEATTTKSSTKTTKSTTTKSNTKTTKKEEGKIFYPPKEDTGFKSYMSWKAITNKSSKQYKLQHDKNAWTDEYGLRRYGDHYMIALGTYYAPKCGRIFRVVLEDGTEFTAIVGDIKADKDTDKTHRYRKDGETVNVVEFIVDSKKLSKKVRKSGDISTLTMKDGTSFESKVKYMELLYSPY